MFGHAGAVGIELLITPEVLRITRRPNATLVQRARAPTLRSADQGRVGISPLRARPTRGSRPRGHAIGRRDPGAPLAHVGAAILGVDGHLDHARPVVALRSG
jgi:hypothetical protein